MLKSRFAISALIIAAASLAAGCDQQDTASSQSITAPEAAPVSAKRASAELQIDSIDVMSSLKNVQTWAPSSCSNGQFTGCPTLRYGDFIEGYSNGVLVGYVSGVRCTSSNEAVAVISTSKCYATVVGAGTAVITITYDHGRLSTTATITAS